MRTNRRALAGARLPTILWFFGASLVAIYVVVGAILYAVGAWQAHVLRTVHRDFPGLSRSAAYARLRSIGYPAVALLGSGAIGDANAGLPWPQTGDVLVRFRYVSRDGFGCGNDAFAILRFRGDRVVKVDEGVWQESCL